MRDSIEPPRIEREALYDDETARHILGLAKATLARAREDGSLRSVRSGNRVVYLGKWLLDWLQAASETDQGLAARDERKEGE